MDDFKALTELRNSSQTYSKELEDWHKSFHKGLVAKISYKFKLSFHDAEEIAQETLFKAVSKIDTFQNDGSFGAWLSVIALNTFRDKYRKETIAVDGPLEINIGSKVTEKEGIRITEYDYLGSQKDSYRKYKFAFKQTEEYDLDAGSSNFINDESLDTLEQELMTKDIQNCMGKAISNFEKIDQEKATAMKMILENIPNDEIAKTLNKSPKAIREYLSQSYKKLRSYAKPCLELLDRINKTKMQGI